MDHPRPHVALWCILMSNTYGLHVEQAMQETFLACLHVLCVTKTESFARAYYHCIIHILFMMSYIIVPLVIKSIASAQLCPCTNEMPSIGLMCMVNVVQLGDVPQQTGTCWAVHTCFQEPSSCHKRVRTNGKGSASASKAMKNFIWHTFICGRSCGRDLSCLPPGTSGTNQNL